MSARPNPEALTPVRHATLNDLADMDRIEREAFDTPWSRELLRGAIYNMRYDVRVLRPLEQPVLGFYIAHTVHRRGNLDNLAVDHRQRQQGLGRRLIDDWIRRCGEEALDALTLQVNTQNTVAQTLYGVYGFRIQRTLRKYYTNGDDAFEMELRLPLKEEAAEQDAQSPKLALVGNEAVPTDHLAAYRLRRERR